jgi:hypothetical protein
MLVCGGKKVRRVSHGGHREPHGGPPRQAIGASREAASDIRLFGVPAAGEQVSKLVQLFVKRMSGDATVAAMRDAVHVHPTLAEACGQALAAGPGIDYAAGDCAAVSLHSKLVSEQRY